MIFTYHMYTNKQTRNKPQIICSPPRSWTATGKINMPLATTAQKNTTNTIFYGKQNNQTYHSILLFVR